MRASILLLSLAFAGPLCAAGPELVRRAHAVSEDRLNEIRELAKGEEAESFFAHAGGGTDDVLAESLRYYLHELGVDLPKSATVRWNRAAHEFAVAAPEALQARIGRMLHSSAEWQIEMDAALISFPLADLEKLARQQPGAGLPGEALQKLWRENGGHLIASAKVLTRPGLTATLFSGDDIPYAGETKALAIGLETNDEPKGVRSTKTIALGTEVVQRRIGMTVELTPTLHKDLRMVESLVAIERSTLTGLRSVPRLAGDGANPPQVLAAEMPSVYAQSVNTGFLAEDGTSHLVGGLPAADGKSQIYLLLTPHVVDSLGRSVAEHDFRGRLLE